MTNSVEFVSDDPVPAAGATGTAQAGNTRPRPATAVATGCWFAAAAACIAGSYANLYRYRFTGSAVATSGGYDANGSPLDRYLAGSEGPRYSVALWVMAALFVALAVVTVRCGTRPLPRAVVMAGVAALGAHAGLLAGLLLYLHSQFATYRGLAVVIRVGQGGVHLSVGACVWLVVAALVLAAAGSAVTAVPSGATGALVGGLTGRRHARADATEPTTDDDQLQPVHRTGRPRSHR